MSLSTLSLSWIDELCCGCQQHLRYDTRRGEREGVYVIVKVEISINQGYNYFIISSHRIISASLDPRPTYSLLILIAHVSRIQPPPTAMGCSKLFLSS